MQQLADKLCQYGLAEVGLISLKACYLGIGPFLNQFAGALDARGMRFGWLVGYRGRVRMVRGPSGLVNHEAVGEEDVALHQFGLKNSDYDRVKIVRGNADILIPGSRRFGRQPQTLDEHYVLRSIT
ncbi:hypothetical protein ACFQU1_07290 [Chelatococcus sp. GCM10030263]|uniref:hypothetical protein n=1 Tax=Chelatococcus sp. GCM10030263 TaxID=3273387 RepID=UPI0036150D89